MLSLNHISGYSQRRNGAFFRSYMQYCHNHKQQVEMVSLCAKICKDFCYIFQLSNKSMLFYQCAQSFVQTLYPWYSKKQTWHCNDIPDQVLYPINKILHGSCFQSLTQWLNPSHRLNSSSKTQNLLAPKFSIPKITIVKQVMNGNKLCWSRKINNIKIKTHWRLGSKTNNLTLISNVNRDSPQTPN